MTVGEWLRAAEAALARVHSPRLEAQLLLGHVLEKDRSWILAHPEFEIQSGEPQLEQAVARRVGHEPLAYILGVREFYGRMFEVGPGALIPRQDTEVLVEAALEAINNRGFRSVLDIGSGSGIIAITIKLERPEVAVTALDVSKIAVDFTRRNASKMSARIEVRESDMFSGVGQEETFELIVSNPPYIGRDESLDIEVREYEPEIALFADEAGLSVYTALANETEKHLSLGGEVWVEVGYQQADPVSALFEGASWSLIEVKKDLAGHSRVLGFRRSG